jgi:hypothetical protein
MEINPTPDHNVTLSYEELVNIQILLNSYIRTKIPDWVLTLKVKLTPEPQKISAEEYYNEYYGTYPKDGDGNWEAFKFAYHAPLKKNQMPKSPCDCL